MITLYSPRQIGLIREAGKVIGGAMAVARDAIKPGATTNQINTLIHEYVSSMGGVPVFLGYTLPTLPPFPTAICSSVNDVIIHGIPDDVPLVEGDVVSIDIGVRKGNYVADAAWTFPVGIVAPETARLLACGEESLARALAAADKHGTVGDIGAAVQQYVESEGFSVVRDFCGHGVGHTLHEEPPVSNYVTEGQTPRLKKGMVIAIEPMVNQGTHEVSWPKGQWIVKTKDSKLSVHFEHTIAIVDGGIEVLTLP
jgi:methionyl aminopeptidase